MAKMMLNGLPYGGLTDKVAFTSSDVADSSVTPATGWTTVDPLVTGENNSSIFTKLSQMFKNVRYLYKKLVASETYKKFDCTVASGITIDKNNSYKVGNIVTLNLSMATLTTPQDWSAIVIATIPDGSRPKSPLVLRQTYGSWSGLIYLNTNGQISLQTVGGGSNKISYINVTVTYVC